MTHRVLLLTSRAAELKPLKSGLLQEGFSIAVLDARALFEERFAPGKIDLVILDLDRSQVEAAKLCHAVKRDGHLKNLPLVLLVTEDQLGRLDFGWGADDYLTLPVSPRRLAERIRFIMWKLNKVELKNGLRLGELAIDFERYEVHIKGEPVDLTYKEFELLKFLASHPGRVFSREALLDKVWGYDYYGGTRTVDVHIRRLRAKIEVHGHVYIDTIRNVGYKFIGTGA